MQSYLVATLYAWGSLRSCPRPMWRELPVLAIFDGRILRLW
jgi:hypothetical protein